MIYFFLQVWTILFLILCSMCKELLWTWGGAINYCPEEGAGAVHLAAGINDEMLALLLQHNADPNLR